MSFVQNSVRTNYLKGINNLVGKEIVDERIEGILADVDMSQLPKGAKLADVYFFLTRELIDKVSNGESKLSSSFIDGLAEAIAVKTWKCNLDYYPNGRSFYNEHWVEHQISDILLDVIGNDVAVICLLKDPEIFEGLLGNVSFEGVSLLDYLNQHIELAKYEYRAVSKGGLGHSFEVINCCEAISTSAEKLGFLGDILEKNKGKHLKAVNKSYGQEK